MKKILTIWMLVLLAFGTVTAQNGPTTLIRDFNITLNGLQYNYNNNTTTFTYLVAGDGSGKDLSHWDLALCQNHGPVNQITGSPGPFTVQQDPAGGNFYGAKWDVSVKINQSKLFTLTLPGIWDTTQVEALVKSGNGYSTGFVTGPACSTIVQKASIGDKVWIDTDKDGIQDAGEAGYQGATVELYSCDNTLISSTTTNASGVYGFSNLNPGDYYIKVILPNGYIFTDKNEGEDDTRDSDVNETSGKTGCVTLSPGENDLTWDAGLQVRPQPTGKVGDRIWNDTDYDGVQDNGEPGIAGVTVKLYDCDNNLIATTTTNASGNYLFSNLGEGEYYILVEKPQGYNFSPKDAGSNDATDSDVNPSTGKSSCFELDDEEEDLTRDAGLYDPLTIKASIGNFVWIDVNANGIQDNGENGLQGVTVRLYNCGGALVSSTTTNSSGLYSFTQLTAGDYSVEVVLPSGYQFSPINQGNNDERDSDVDPNTGRTACYTLSPGEDDMTADAGVYVPVVCATDWSGGLGPTQSICEPAAQYMTVNGSVNLLPAGTRAQLITSWQVISPNPVTNCPPIPIPCNDLHTTTKWIYSDTTFSIEGWWPGITPTSTEVRLRFTMTVLDCDGNTIKEPVTRDLYWTPVVCPPPSSPNADLSLTKTVNDTIPQNGDVITYTLTLTSGGPGTTTNIKVADVLPAGLVYQSSNATIGSYDPNTGIWDVPTLAAGASAVLNINVEVDLSTISTTAIDLGAATGFNLFVLEDLNQPSSDTEGKAAVGRDATLANYSVGDKLPNSNGTEDVFIVGRNLNFISGAVFGGNVVYGNYSNMPHNQATVNNGTVRQGYPIDFTVATSQLNALSQQLAAYSANATAGFQYGKLSLVGSNPFVNVFEVHIDTLDLANDLEIDVPNGSTVIVNIRGQYGWWNGGLNVYGTSISNVLYNFYEADSLRISHIDVKGSILAPRTNVNFVSGVQNGQMIAKNVIGTGQFNNVLFSGNIPQDTTVINVAEVVQSVLNDPDSNPNNHLNTEDDYSSAKITIKRVVTNTQGTNYNWTPVASFSMNEIILTMTLDNNGNILAGTWGGKIYRSTDNGLTWERINESMLCAYVWSMTSNAAGTIYAATERGIYKSADNGTTWVIAGLNGRDIRSLLVDGNKIYAGIWGAGVYVSNDNGSSWEEFSEGIVGNSVHSLAKDGNGNIYAGLFDGGVFKLGAGNTVWFNTNSSSRYIWSMAVNSLNHIYAGTYGNGMIRSTDGGATWERINTGLPVTHIYAVRVDVNDNVYISSWGGGMYVYYLATDNPSNVTWSDFGLYGAPIPSISFNSNNTVMYAGTEDGTIYATNIVTDVKDDNKMPTEFRLSQNYPNPFNPSTVIEFALPQKEFVNITIYNILGQKVRELINSEFNPGVHRLTFNGVNLASGVYFYRIQAGRFAETKKMLLQK